MQYIALHNTYIPLTHVDDVCGVVSYCAPGVTARLKHTDGKQCTATIEAMGNARAIEELYNSAGEIAQLLGWVSGVDVFRMGARADVVLRGCAFGYPFFLPVVWYEKPTVSLR